MATPVTVDALRARARRLIERDGRAWAATGDDSAVLETPLHPPTEQQTLSDLDAARAWVASWRRADRSDDITVTWILRDWSRVGSQELPVRVVVRGPDALARVAGVQKEWAELSKRLRMLRALGGEEEGVAAALRMHARTIAELSVADFERLVGVLAWLRENPSSGRRVRELPIRGIHTKWIEARRGLIEALHRAFTGASGLGLHEADPLVRVRFLDAKLAPAGLSDIAVPVSELARLDVEPVRVFVFENLATFLAMPPVPGAVVLDGGGQRVELVARLPWVSEVTYWGDLDSHGFAILHRLRSHDVAVTSVLMDAETLTAHRDLWGVDDSPNTGVLPSLTTEEQTTLRLLASEGNVRLEQERIPWEYALPRLGVAR